MLKSYFCCSESNIYADRVIIRLPCGQGQLSRIWKVQRDWLSLGKECCFRLSRRLWEGMKNELPQKRLRGRLGETITVFGSNFVAINCSSYLLDKVRATRGCFDQVQVAIEKDQKVIIRHGSVKI